MADDHTRKQSALDGVSIIDLTWLQVGPQATRLLATFGAQVIRIEWRKRAGRRLSPLHAAVRPQPRNSRRRPQPGRRPQPWHPRQLRSRRLLQQHQSGQVRHHAQPRIIQRAAICSSGWCATPTPSAKTSVPARWISGASATTNCASSTRGSSICRRPASAKPALYKNYVSYGPTAQAFSGLTFLSGLPEPSSSRWMGLLVPRSFARIFRRDAPDGGVTSPTPARHRHLYRHDAERRQD